MWSCSSPRKKTPRKNRRPAKQKTPRILPIWGRVLGVLFRYRSIWHKCAACIRRMQYTKGSGLSQQAFCNAKMAFVYTNALLATMVLVLRSSHIDEAGILQASKQSRLYSYIFPKFFDRRYSSGERQNCFLNTAANFP